MPTTEDETVEKMDERADPVGIPPALVTLAGCNDCRETITERVEFDVSPPFRGGLIVGIVNDKGPYCKQRKSLAEPADAPVTNATSLLAALEAMLTP